MLHFIFYSNGALSRSYQNLKYEHYVTAWADLKRNIDLLLAKDLHYRLYVETIQHVLSNV